MWVKIKNMMQFFKKIGDFLFTRLGKNQSTQIQELDPRRPDLLAEDLPFDLTEAGVNEIHSDLYIVTGKQIGRAHV